MHSTDPTSDSRGLGKGMLIVFWLIVIGLLTWGFANWEGRQYNPNTAPQSRETAQYREVILDSNNQHHYVASGAINGQSVTFLLDTGATDVVIPEGLAKKLDLVAGQSQMARTANGVVQVHATRLDTLELGNIRLYDVRASINPGMRGDQVLLGMSALRSIDFQQRNGQLILRQEPQ